MQSVEEILGKLETADNTTKNRIENILVDKGKAVVPELVHQLQVVRGVKRGVVAMTLIELAKLLLNILKKLLIITKILNGLQNTLFLKLKA